MSGTNFSRIELLDKQNFDTWKLQMQAVLIKADLWEYANGTSVKPERGEDDASRAREQAWIKSDQKAKADIILSICASELKQVKNCSTSREMWLKLEEIYQSKGPARKATLLKRLTVQKMAEGSDVRDHLNQFFDTVDKLADMEIEINPDLLTVMLLYSLPGSYENFRCAIESRDNLPTPDVMRTKIIEESDARKSSRQTENSDAMLANKYSGHKREQVSVKVNDNKKTEEKPRFKFQCHICKKFGHKKSECRFNKNNNHSAKAAEELCLNVTNHSAIGLCKNWCLDSGASTHLCNDDKSFQEITDPNHGVLNLANNSTSKTLGKGTVKFTSSVSGDLKCISLANTSHAPDLRTNLLSVSKITDQGYDVVFNNKCAKILDSKGEIKLYANRIGNLYYVNEAFESACAVSNGKVCKTTLETLHRRFGHGNFKDIRDAVKKGAVTGVELVKSETIINCDTCLKGKMTRTPFPKGSDRKSKILEIIHTDVWGPIQSTSLGGAKYYVEFIDDHSKYCEIRFLKSKAEVLEKTKEYVALVEKQKGKSVKVIQSDNGREYVNTEFDNYLKQKGISRRLTVPHNPEQNGTAERKNRTLLDTARCMLMDAELPNHFWAEAVNTANYVRNRMPARSLDGKTPFEAWTGNVPDISNLRIFGSKVYYLDRNPERSKLDQRGHEGVFLGYSDESKGYRIWSKEKRKVIVSRDVKFFEFKNTHHKTGDEDKINNSSNNNEKKANVVSQSWSTMQHPKISK